jgi:hypothetical protein
MFLWVPSSNSRDRFVQCHGFLRRVVLILTCLFPGTKGDYFRHHPEQLRGGQEEGNGFLAKPSANEWCMLLFEHLDFIGLTHTSSVAITRAQALLIVVGDPEVLGKDELWRTFLNYACLRGGWTGKMPSWEPEDEVPVPGYEVTRRAGGVVHGESFMNGKSEKIYRFFPRLEEAAEEERTTSW